MSPDPFSLSKSSAELFVGKQDTAPRHIQHGHSGLRAQSDSHLITGYIQPKIDASDRWIHMGANMGHDEEPQPLINKSLASILGGAGVALVPVSIYVTMAYLHTDKFNVRGLRFVVFVVWCLLSFVLLGPVLIIGLLPAFCRFAYGPPRFRKRWFILQLLAWIGTLLFGAIGVAYWMGHRSRGPGEALIFHGVPTVVAAFALYLSVMSFMPAPFFDEDQMGQRVKLFLGVKSTKLVPLVCFGAALALGAIASFISWTTASTIPA